MSYVTLWEFIFGVVLVYGNGGGWRRFLRLWIQRGRWSITLTLGLNVWGLGVGVKMPDSQGDCGMQALVGPLALEVARG
jgi:hypothetical protein